jgi:hypothetical protein
LFRHGKQIALTLVWLLWREFLVLVDEQRMWGDIRFLRIEEPAKKPSCETTTRGIGREC